MINAVSKLVKVISYVIYSLIYDLSGDGNHRHSKNYFPNIGYQLEFFHSTLTEEDCDFAM